MADGTAGSHETAHDRLRGEGAMARDNDNSGFIGGFGFGPDSMAQGMKNFTEMFGQMGSLPGLPGLNGMSGMPGLGQWSGVQGVLTEWTKQQVEDAMQTAQKMAGCRSAADVVALQMELLHRSFERGQSHTSEILTQVRDAFVSSTGGGEKK
jgi:hypothetical protein